MDIQESIKQELFKIHRSRNRTGYFPSIIALGISIYFQRDALALDLRWYFALGLMVVGTILRVVVGEFLYKKYEQDHLGVVILNVLSFLMLSLAWGLHFSDVYYHYGAYSSEVNYTLLIIAAFMIGMSTSLVADKKSYFFHVIPLGLSVVLTYILDSTNTHAYIILNVFLFLIFSFVNYKVNHKQLCDLIEARLLSQEEQERLKNLINVVPGFVGFINKDMVCYMANSPTTSIFPGIVGKKIGTIDQNSEWERHILEFMQSSRSSDISEERVRFKGEDIFLVLNIQKMKDGGAIVVSIVTTELVEAKNIIRDQEAKAQYSARLASLGQMAAGIAHEVNNPLAIIQGSASVIKKLITMEPLDKENISILADKLMQTTERISRIIRSLKALSRDGEKDPMTAVSTKHLIELCLDISAQRFKLSGIELRLPDPIPEFTVLGREVQLSQVIVNLLSNALDALKNQEDKWVELKIQKKDDWVDILVTDSGPGIPSEIQSKIMDPFFTTKDVNQGTGLGLSISKTIISDHKGELSYLEKEPHTTFRIRLSALKEGSAG